MDFNLVAASVQEGRGDSMPYDGGGVCEGVLAGGGGG